MRSEGATERFERLAADFFDATGVLAPGKDDAIGNHGLVYRTAAWRTWLAERGRTFPIPQEAPDERR